jgi:hypothetical protein
LCHTIDLYQLDLVLFGIIKLLQQGNFTFVILLFPLFIPSLHLFISIFPELSIYGKASILTPLPSYPEAQNVVALLVSSCALLKYLKEAIN